MISIGGWDGSDNSPTLAQFKAYISEGKITYYLSSGSQGGGMGGSSGTSASAIQAWVAKRLHQHDDQRTTVYDLTSSSG